METKPRYTGLYFVEDHPCALCGESDRPVLVKNSKDTNPFGICEICSINASYEWKKVNSELPPNIGAPKEVSKVFVLVPRLKTDESPSALLDSYQFLMVKNPDDPHLDLPSHPFVTSEENTALLALDQIGVMSWKWTVEVLFRGYTPRGNYVAIALATAWSKKNGFPLEFRSWPIENHVSPSMRGLYRAFKEIWPLRLYKWSKAGDFSGQISTFVREATREYIRIKQDIANGAQGVDTSMVEYYRKTMTPNELRVAKICTEGEKLDEEVTSLKPEIKDENKLEEGGSPSTEVSREEPSTEAEFSELPGLGAEEFEAEIESDDLASQGFVTRGRPLKAE